MIRFGKDGPDLGNVSIFTALLIACAIVWILNR